MVYINKPPPPHVLEEPYIGGNRGSKSVCVYIQ